MARPRKHRHVERQTLRDVPDRELMEVIVSVEDDDGKVDSRAIADMFQMQGPHALQCVGARLSWMKRWGFMRSYGKGVWAITPKGRQLIAIRVTSDRVKMMTGMGEAEWCATVSAASQRPTHRMSESAWRMARREWIHYQGRRA
jgi:hypothetical protein